ncbi:Putrescine hydroxycinnamoyltransferase 2 [Lasiodiplodia theobromae]|uniref:Putrescine hydroxycinnamoyltransferase 2 n=1 Tax=Lasiodiplodia theobromae TaxID=45133 RepID=A0A5N5CZ73_9PEZI|nr:Putrescine hydroxycinnamoyltransferase 2 [Lasiodiplodia theobromae]
MNGTTTPRETRTIQVIDAENDPPEEIIPLSDLDNVYVRVYVPITSTYKLDDDVDRELVIDNLCKGLQKTTKEYRFLGGHVFEGPNAKSFVKRSPAWPTLTLHINHLEDTDFPSYADLERREFPFSDLNERHMAPDFTLPADPKTAPPDQGLPTILAQLNFIRGGLILGTALHHQCVDAKGVDVVLARWAANTRALFHPGVPAPPFDPSCLDPTPMSSKTPLSPERIPEVERRIRSFKYVPVLPHSGEYAAPVQLAQSIFHLPRSRLAALKASTIPREADAADKWVSTNDCITALLWRCMTRARLPSPSAASAAADPDNTSVHMHMAVDIRPYTDPPLHGSYPGNAVSVSYVSSPLSSLIDPSPSAFAAAAQAIRATVDAWRAPSMIKDTQDYLASFPDDPAGVRQTFTFAPGQIATIVTSWSVMAAYREHDFGWGGLRALRLATGAFNNTFFIYPRRVREGSEGEDEGTEVFVAMEKGDMERLRRDPELLRWAELRAC